MTRMVVAVALLVVVMTLPGTLARPTFAQMGMPSEFEERSARTASYIIKIRIGPKVTMSNSSMSSTDQGKPVNRHLEVHTFNKSTGEEIKNLVPAVRVTNQATGSSHLLTNLVACRVSRHRETEPHFGDNVYLPDGAYTITVTVGKDTAVFKDVTFKP